MSPSFCFLLLTTLVLGQTNAQDATPAETLLHSKGIDDYVSIVYYKRSDNVSTCLQRPDAVARLLHMCQARSFVEACLEEDREVVGLDFCQGVQCTGRFSSEHSRCLLNLTGIVVMNENTKDSQGCLPESERHLYEWDPPLFARAIGDTNSFDCLTALPKGSLLERRIVCDEGDPRIEHRLVFESKDFLRTDERNVRCLSAVSCGLPTILSGEFVCYEVEGTIDDGVQWVGASLAAVVVWAAVFLLMS